MKLNEIAARINEYLQKFEKDLSINKIDPKNYTCKFYYANAYSGGKFVFIKYINSQGSTPLTRERAERYLAWLEAGNVGMHFEMME